MSLKTLLRNADRTVPGEVVPLHDWAKIETAIHRCRNYVVSCEAEEAKLEGDLERAKEKHEEARQMLDEAERLLLDTVRNVLGVRLERVGKKELDP